MSESRFAGVSPERLVIEVEGKRYAITGRIVAVIWKLLQWRTVFALDDFKGKLVFNLGTKADGSLDVSPTVEAIIE